MALALHPQGHGGRPDPLPNTAKVTGVDVLGGPHGTVSAEDSASVDLLQPTRDPDPLPPAAPPAAKPAGQGGVLGVSQRPVSGRASLRGASGCVSRAFRAVVSGRQIRRVTFFVDGKRVARRSARGNQRSFSLRVRPGGMRPRRPPGDRPRGVPHRLGHPPADATC